MAREAAPIFVAEAMVSDRPIEEPVEAGTNTAIVLGKIRAAAREIGNTVEEPMMDKMLASWQNDISRKTPLKLCFLGFTRKPHRSSGCAVISAIS